MKKKRASREELAGRLPVDVDQWSEAARRRLGYLPAPSHYEDRRFKCRSCQSEAFFTAAQQKHEYEVKKAHYLRQHVLCPPCFARRSELQALNDHFESSWMARDQGLSADVPALLVWLDVLNELPRYGLRRDTARIRMLEKLIEDLVQSGCDQALELAARQGWEDVSAGRYADVADDRLEDFIGQLGKRAAKLAKSAR